MRERYEGLDSIRGIAVSSFIINLIYNPIIHIFNKKYSVSKFGGRALG